MSNVTSAPLRISLRTTLLGRAGMVLPCAHVQPSDAVNPKNDSRVRELTVILQRLEQGDPHAAHELLPLVYEGLRKLAAQKMAHESPGQTLQATALAHEAWRRLGRSEFPNRRPSAIGPTRGRGCFAR